LRDPRDDEDEDDPQRRDRDRLRLGVEIMEIRQDVLQPSLLGGR
jgi:hypothetical protein